MRPPAFLLALSLSITAALAGGYAPADFPSYTTLPSQAKPWFQHLAAAQNTPQDVLPLAKVPQAEPAIVELMQKIINDPARKLCRAQVRGPKACAHIPPVEMVEFGEVDSLRRFSFSPLTAAP